MQIAEALYIARNKDRQNHFSRKREAKLQWEDSCFRRNGRGVEIYPV